MAGQTGKRVRRSVEASKQAILETAERYLIADGPAGVKVQRVAHDLGLTDAAVHYHFGSREKLLEALLRFSGRRFIDALSAAIEADDGEAFDLQKAAGLLTDLYDRRGTARLAMWLSLEGWSPAGAGMLEPLVDWLHKARMHEAKEQGLPAPQKTDTRRQVAVLSAVTFSQALAGDALRRSVGLGEKASDGLAAWTAKLLTHEGGLPS
ncbi:MAG: TetR/AcrR family transcriptional regulator [Parvibaculum sp.]